MVSRQQLVEDRRTDLDPLKVSRDTTTAGAGLYITGILPIGRLPINVRF